MNRFVFMKSSLSVFFLGWGVEGGRLVLFCTLPTEFFSTFIVVLHQGPEDICLLFSIRSLIVLVLTIGSLIYLQLILWGRGQYLFSRWSSSYSTHLLKRFYFFHWIAVGPLLKMNDHIFGSVLDSNLFHLNYLSILSSVLHFLNYHSLY